MSWNRNAAKSVKTIQMLIRTSIREECPLHISTALRRNCVDTQRLIPKRWSVCLFDRPFACVYLSVRLSVCLSVCPFVRLPVCPSGRLIGCPSGRLAVCSVVRRSVRLAVWPSVRTLRVWPYGCLSVSAFVRPSVRLSVVLSSSA